MHFLARRPRMAFFAAGTLLFAGTPLAQPTAPLSTLEVTVHRAEPSDLSVMTYNVKGLPWPIAIGRGAALERIANRLSSMRDAGAQPAVVVLQEAFVSQAKSIGDRAGYRYQASGAKVDARPVARSRRAPFQRRNRSPQLDSGLVILSDYPILDVRRSAFPQSACAGIDCFAAKGIVLVTLAVPGKGRIDVATTHLNSRGASWASTRETERAYREQVAFLTEFLATQRDPANPMILAGDFNLGNREERLAILPPALETLNGGNAPKEPLRNFLDEGKIPIGRSSDARWVVDRARDMQYVLPGDRQTLAPVAASIPFGTERGGDPLSDHFGYTIDYRLTVQDSRIAARP